jgi:hypothetical protein
VGVDQGMTPDMAGCERQNTKRTDRKRQRKSVCDPSLSSPSLVPKRHTVVVHLA